MKITIGEETRRLMDILGIQDFPFTEKALQAQWRVLAKEYHPDRNKNPDYEEKLKEINSAYEELRNLALPEITETQSRKVKKQYDQEKEDIFTFWEPCESCNGTGNIVVNENFHWLTPRGKPKYVVHVCRACKGLGKKKLEFFNPLIPKGAVL